MSGPDKQKCIDAEVKYWKDVEDGMRGLTARGRPLCYTLGCSRCPLYQNQNTDYTMKVTHSRGCMGSPVDKFNMHFATVHPEKLYTEAPKIPRDCNTCRKLIKKIQSWVLVHGRTADAVNGILKGV